MEFVRFESKICGGNSHLHNKYKEEEERQTFFKVGMNKMPIQPTHDVMSIEHAINGAGLLIPLGVDTIITK